MQHYHSLEELVVSLDNLDNSVDKQQIRERLEQCLKCVNLCDCHKRVENEDGTCQLFKGLPHYLKKENICQTL